MVAADEWTEPWPGYVAAVEAAPMLALEEDVLGRLQADLSDSGLIGEQDTAAIVMLAMAGLKFDRQHIVSVAIKGQSSSGKSNAMKRVLEMWTEVRPSSDEGEYISFGSVSPKALVYDKRSFEHRMLVMEEAIGLSKRDDDIATQLRLMLSEGHFEHLVTDGTEGIKTRDRGTESIRKNGPSGFMVTTTLLKLEEELETRLVSVYTDESERQTARIVRSTAAAAGIRSLRASRRTGDEWRQFTRWLRDGANASVVLDEDTEDMVARLSGRLVRSRRDAGKVIGLIKAHAMLHQFYRAQEAGHVVADMRDYEAVARLLRPVLDREHQTAVPEHVRKVVAAVAEATTPNGYGGCEYPSTSKVAEAAGKPVNTTRRWLIEAQQMGYVHNLAPGNGRPDRWATDAEMPEEEGSVLPSTPRPEPLLLTITRLPDGRLWAPFPWSAPPVDPDPPNDGRVERSSSEAVSAVERSRTGLKGGGGFGGYSTAEEVDIGPRDCGVCGLPLDPVLARLGYQTHGETEEA
jgi:hypothetical protein